MSQYTLKKQYDIVIIGAGPAGLNAGMSLIDNAQNHSILLVDKITPWEKPIPCAEGVGKIGFHNAVSVDKSWIRQEIYSACFHAPNNTAVTYTDKFGGYIIDRTKMQHDLAETLQKNGITCLFSKRVRDILPCSNNSRDILFDDNSTVNAKIVIDASGPVGGFGKNEKIACKPLDLEPAYFALVENISIAPDTIHIYLGKNFAPGGYAWVFPRGNNCANIGLVVNKRSFVNVKYNIRNLLDSFIKEYYPNVKIVRLFAGTIPCTSKKETIAVPRLIKTGDSASTINPISRAGISEALLSGKLAGQYALEMLNAKTDSQIRSICKQYEKAWQNAKGKRHVKLAKAKNTFVMIPDEDYNNGAAILSSIEQKKLTMSKIFRESLGKFPRLVWAMRHLM